MLPPVEVRKRASMAPAPAPRKKALTGLALLWHDHWDDAHAIAQEHEGDCDFDLLHAILHRREGDFGNARYWFASAGSHPCFALLEKSLRAELPESGGERSRLLPDNRWSPAGFAALVAAAVAGRSDIRSPEPERVAENLRRLVRIQELETRAFGDWLISG